jgi:hypothetical protein
VIIDCEYILERLKCVEVFITFSFFLVFVVDMAFQDLQADLHLIFALLDLFAGDLTL